MRDTGNLAAAGDLRVPLSRLAKRAVDAVGALDEEEILVENEDLLVQRLASPNCPEPITLHWDSLARTKVKETTTKRRHDFTGETITVPGLTFDYVLPASGSLELLNYRANQGYMSYIPGVVRGDAIVLTFTGLSSMAPEQIEREVANWKEHVTNLATWANTDLQAHKISVESGVRAAIQARKERLLRARSLEASLGVPLMPTSPTRSIPVAVERRVIQPERRRASSEFVPEYALEEAQYQDILTVCERWARGFERSPQTAAKFDEEEIRDQLLITLNSHWSGQAGGELFNGVGKTDILIREGDRNVFIAELKIYSGPAAVVAAINQLLGYLVWRDSKAALIVIVRNQRASEAVEKIYAAVEGHPRCRLAKPATDAAQSRHYVLEADDEGRTISLAVLPVVTPTGRRA
jgi:hypothetical protein